MRKPVALILVLIACAVVGGAAYVYRWLTNLRVERVTDDVHVIFGLGGNVGVLRTAAGAVVVDTMTFRFQGRRIRELAEELGGGPIQAVINTHYHRDHTHGNPAFEPGTRVVSTERTLHHLKHRDSDYWRDEAQVLLPNLTFADVRQMSIGGKTIRAIHPGRGHTDGDLVVLFVEDRVLHAGDLLFNGRYPNIDLEAGGSVQHWDSALDQVSVLDFERVIPGHGPVTDREGLKRFQDFIRELWQVGKAAAEQGRSLEETLAAANLRTGEGYEVISIPFVMRLDRDFVVRRAWEEATGAVTPAD